MLLVLLQNLKGFTHSCRDAGGGSVAVDDKREDRRFEHTAICWHDTTAGAGECGMLVVHSHSHTTEQTTRTCAVSWVQASERVQCVVHLLL